MADSSENSKTNDADPRLVQLEELIKTRINPALAGHGGFVELIDVKDNKVMVKMGGGCQGCAMAKVTVKQGVEALIKENIDGIEEVVDVTEHADGENPYC